MLCLKKKKKKKPNGRGKITRVYIIAWESFSIPTFLETNEILLSGYKINIQKSVAFLYANSKLSEREIKKTISFTIASKRTKYLGINLTKEVKELYTEHYKTLMKEIEQATKDGKIDCVHGLEELILLKLLPKAIYIFNAILTVIPMSFLQK